MSDIENTDHTEPSIKFGPQDYVDGVLWFNEESFKNSSYSDPVLRTWMDTAKVLAGLAIDPTKQYPVASQENWEIIRLLGFARRKPWQYHTGKLSSQP